MRTMRVFVADDEPLALRRVLRSLDAMKGLEVVGTASDGTEALEAIRALKPDLLLLDIMMPGLTGFDLLSALDQASPPAVVFVTAFDRFAVGAFEEGALDYILKPIDDERMRLAIERARSRIDEEANRRRFDQLRATLARMNTDFGAAISAGYERDLWVREGGNVRRIRIEDIDWIEAAGDYVALHVGGASHLADDSISSLATRLDPAMFQQVHRSAIVRLDAVVAVNREKFSAISLLMKDGETVRVSKSFKRAALDRLDPG